MNYLLYCEIIHISKGEKNLIRRDDKRRNKIKSNVELIFLF